MKMNVNCSKPLAKGQIWTTRVAHIEIVGLGKELIHYKITSQLGLRKVSAQLSGIEAMQNYLRVNAAELRQEAVANAN
jgi:hypothetical protein